MTMGLFASRVPVSVLLFATQRFSSKTSVGREGVLRGQVAAMDRSVGSRRAAPRSSERRRAKLENDSRLTKFDL
jgi:hypothetical protein